MKNIKTQYGFSTLEIIISFTILTLSLSAVILIAFSNKAYAIDTNLAQRALYITRTKLETSIAEAISNFPDVKGYSENIGIYQNSVTINDISECAKRIDVKISWTQGLRNLDTKLSKIVTNTEVAKALGADCATEEISSNWHNPAALTDIGLIDTMNITAIDEFNNYLFLASNPLEAEKDDLLIYKFDEVNSTLSEVSSLNTHPGHITGMNDIDVAGDYLYVAHTAINSQLMVIDVSDPNKPIILWEIPLPHVDPLGSYPAATTIYYYDDRVYIGTAETNGPEFHIFDVSSISNKPPRHLGSLELTHNVNDIIVSGNYAYLATSDNNHELMVLDISNPTNLIHPDLSNLGFNAPDDQDASSLYLGGNHIYLGRNQSNPRTNSFYILDQSSILNASEISDGIIGTYDIGLKNNTRIADILVSGDLAFIAVDDTEQGLIIYNISDPANIKLPSNCSSLNYSEKTVSLDNNSQNNYIFTANGNNQAVSVIHNKNSQCQL